MQSTQKQPTSRCSSGNWRYPERRLYCRCRLDEHSTGHVDAGKAGQQLWTDVDAILADTNELQTDDTPAALAAMDAKLDTIDNFLDTEVAAIEDTGTMLSNLRLNNPSRQVNAEVVDALATDTYAEPGQGAPAATTSLSTKIGHI